MVPKTVKIRAIKVVNYVEVMQNLKQGLIGLFIALKLRF